PWRHAAYSSSAIAAAPASEEGAARDSAGPEPARAPMTRARLSALGMALACAGLAVFLAVNGRDASLVRKANDQARGGNYAGARASSTRGSRRSGRFVASAARPAGARRRAQPEPGGEHEDAEHGERDRVRAGERQVPVPRVRKRERPTLRIRDATAGTSRPAG